MSERSLRIRLGVFVLMAVILLATLIILFGSLPDVFKRTRTYVVRFTDAPGLTAGAPVRRSGVRIGTVRDIILDEERGIVRVRIAIDQPYVLRHSEQATLVTGLLGSDTSIDFIPRQAEGEPPDRAPFEPGAELVGIRAASVNTLLNRASEVVPTTQETLNDIRKSMQRLEKLAAQAEKLVPTADETMKEYRALAKSARETLPELRRTNDEVRELARSARQAVPGVERTSDEVRELAKTAREAVPQVRQTAADISSLSKSVQDALPETRRAVTEVGEFARSARQTIPSLERTNDEVRELAKTARETIPELRKTSDDIGAAARYWSRVGERADLLLQNNQEKLSKAIDNFNETLTRTNRLLSDDNLRNVDRTLANTNKASERLPDITRSADDILNQGRGTVRQLNGTLKRLDAVLDDILRITRPLGGRSETLLRNLEESSIKLNATLDDVRALFRVVDRSDGTLRKFLTDPSIYNNIDAATCMILKVMPRLDPILKDFETFADKLARHPEVLGAGGIVRPSNGLKNPPTPPLPPGGTSFPPGHGVPVQVVPGPGAQPH